MLMIGIRQFFTRQNFPNPDSSKFSTVKILRHTVCEYCKYNKENAGEFALDLPNISYTSLHFWHMMYIYVCLYVCV